MAVFTTNKDVYKRLVEGDWLGRCWKSGRDGETGRPMAESSRGRIQRQETNGASDGW